MAAKPEVKKVLDMMKEHSVEYVDLRFTDPRGKWQHTAQHVSTIDEDVFFDGFGLHAGWGYLVIPLGLLFMVIGIIAGIGKWRLGRHGLLFLLLFIQLWLAWIGFEVPFPVGFLHPVNAFVIAALSGWIVWDEWHLWRERKAGVTPAAAAPA